MDTETVQSPLPFATDVVRRFRDCAQELAKEPGIKAFCSPLAAGLADVQKYLEDAWDAGKSDGSSERRVLKLLDNLEILCQWPNSRATRPSSASPGFDRKRYANLDRALSKKILTKKVIKNFASDPRAKTARMGFIRKIKSFIKPEKTNGNSDMSDLLGPPETQQRSSDYRGYIRALYRTLATHCLCPRPDGRREITVNLRLNGCCAPGDVEGSVNFRLFFLDHPHYRDGSSSCQWQDAQVCVMERKRVKFDSTEEASDNNFPGRVISIDRFCELITNRNRSQLKLAVSEAGLVLKGPGPLSQGFLLSTSSISLAELLSAAVLPRKMRLLLSYFLAKAAWLFYDSDWMQSEWTKETVHFMFERRSTTPQGIFVNEPFLSAHFQTTLPSEEDDSVFRSHLFPKILALGIMLLEIELGISIEDFRPPECLGHDGRPSVNADHIAAMEVFEKTGLWDRKDTFPSFKDVVGLCLTPDIFKVHLNDTDSLRDTLEKSIVNPLQALYRNAWGDPDHSRIRAVEIDRAVVPEHIEREENHNLVSPQPIQPAPIPYLMPHCSTLSHEACWTHASYQPAPYTLMAYPYASIPDVLPRHGVATGISAGKLGVSPSATPLPDSVMASYAPRFSSDVWFQELDRLNSVLRGKPKEKGYQYRPTKIAILDTGVHECYAESVKGGYEDFVDRDSDDWQDRTLHGTHAVRLIQKVYNMAEIYVARVFESSTATATTATLMAQAIDHAIDVWKVDIIVMPSGFKSSNRDMIRAIDEANRSHVLIFAAASNYGNVTEIAFPGRLYISGKLLCMFSTDANVRCSPTFNPSPSGVARYSFAVLGENVVLPPLDPSLLNRAGGDKPLSGTSFATMIGAALAGRILDFSRQKDACEQIRCVESLHTVEGMSAVFSKMVRGAVDNGYHCIAPWKVLPPETPEDDPGKKRLTARTHVCETISRALEDMYGE